jgi:hypothetical protein
METFVVRAWRSTGDDDAAGGDDTLRGVVEHVGTGATAPFQDEEQLIDFLRARPGDGG